MKNTSLRHKNTSLFSVIEGHFKGELNLARVKLICLFITALCKTKTINNNRIASAFDTNTDESSSYIGIQRFMKDFDFPMKVIAMLIFNLLPFKENLVLVFDRTNWKFGERNINILMFVWCYKIGYYLGDTIKRIVIKKHDKRAVSVFK